MKKNRLKNLILILDDSKTQLMSLQLQLEAAGYIVLAFEKPIQALNYLTDEKSILPDIIISDITMPEMDGFEFLTHVKKNCSLAKIPFMFLTSLDDKHNQEKGLELGAVDYIFKPYNAGLIKTRLKTHIELMQHKERLVDLIDKKTEELELLQQVTIECIASLAEYRDNETGSHIYRTQIYIKILAKELSRNPKYENIIDKKFIKLLFQSAPLHDIGKVGIPDDILLKPGKLTKDEFEQMKAHTVIGSKTLENADKRMHKESFLHHAVFLAGSHHERWDGKGYPKGLKGEEIPLFARLMSVVDAYDALVSKRVYKEPVSHNEAVEIIKKASGTQFDPDIVSAFLNINTEFYEIAVKYADENPHSILTQHYLSNKE